MRPHDLCRSLIFAAALAALPVAAAAEEAFTVASRAVGDDKAVFATVESLKTIAARARIGGTIVALRVKAGDHVDAGALIATIADDKIALQLKALDAQIDALEAAHAKAETDLGRVETLAARGVSTQAQLDNARTALAVAAKNLEAKTAERAVTVQQASEGNVLAPTGGRVLTVPVTTGTVMMPGEAVATVAEENFILRLALPERHARFLRAGDPVRIDRETMPARDSAAGVITLVYPEINNGRVEADARVEGLGDYFVGERVRVWVSAGERQAMVVPKDFVTARFGIDSVHLKTATGAVEVPVQRGRPLALPDLADGLELLSGVRPGDVLVKP